MGYRLFSLINENFDTRLSIYGKDALGSANLEMVDIARRHGSCAKFSGSGGAIFGMCLDEKKKVISHVFAIFSLCHAVLSRLLWQWSFKKEVMYFVIFNHMTPINHEFF